VDAVLEVIRDFEDTDIHHVNGSIDPARDIEIIRLELVLADLETLSNRMSEVTRKARS
jgi:ribosome-binding ATPase YchF (GTP1/OBG family)